MPKGKGTAASAMGDTCGETESREWAEDGFDEEPLEEGESDDGYDSLDSDEEELELAETLKAVQLAGGEEAVSEAAHYTHQGFWSEIKKQRWRQVSGISICELHDF
jgi:hypothetical protein